LVWLHCHWSSDALTLASRRDPGRYAGSSWFLPPLGKPPPARLSNITTGGVEVTRLRPNIENIRSDGTHSSPHECDLGLHADKDACLTRPGRGCMWTHLEGVDTTVSAQAGTAYSYCLPCNMDGEELPCWNPGAWVGGMQVKDCQMSCSHQTRLWQPGYACTDTTGTIGKAECFEQGTQSGSKCMFLMTEDHNGNQKSTCTPCELPGTGTWGCPAISEDGWKVTECDSQCNVECTGPSCPQALQNLGEVPTPGVKKASSDADAMLTVPVPFLGSAPAAAAPAQDKAAARGSMAAPTVPPNVYIPVLMYRSPADWAAFRTPPPPSVSEPWPEDWQQAGAE